MPRINISKRKINRGKEKGEFGESYLWGQSRKFTDNHPCRSVPIKEGGSSVQILTNSRGGKRGGTFPSTNQKAGKSERAQKSGRKKGNG